MAASDPIERLSGTTLEGRFALDAFVARGGYGAVYRGMHLALGCPVAVKVLAVPDEYEGGARTRFVEAFEREARTVAALRHPAIVRVHDFGVTAVGDRAHPYMVLEWIEGATLAAAQRGAAGRSPREALALLRPVLDAIASAHEAGVVHRDIKPANVMVTSTRRGELSTRVLDFGVAKVRAPDEGMTSGDTHTRDDHAAFSFSHAAPEQVGRLRTGPWTDVHALALLVVEVIVGQRAYRGDTDVELFTRITAPERPTPATFAVAVGPWEPALARALALLPSARHADAAALLADLELHVDAAQRAWESKHAAPARRSPWPLALAALACAAAATAWARWTPDAQPPRVERAPSRPPTARVAPPAVTDHTVAPPRPAAAEAPPREARATVEAAAPRRASARANTRAHASRDGRRRDRDRVRQPP